MKEMRIYIDSGDPEQVTKYLESGICDGVTTNPTIMRKCGVHEDEMLYRQIELANLIHPRPLSVEVTSDIPKEILEQANYFKENLPENIMVKVTATDSKGQSLLPVIYKLASQGITLNVTAMVAYKQCILAATALANGDKAWGKIMNPPHAVSIFAGRISEEHGSVFATQVIKDIRQWLDNSGVPVELIVGSVRSAENVIDWSMARPHIMTIPPAVLDKVMTAARSTETVQQFLDDARKALEA